MILADLVEWPEHLLVSALWKAATAILYVDKDAINFGVRVQ
jgi:hypothetical protein